MRPISFDQERVHFNLARLRKGGRTFEVAVDPDLAIAFKESGKGDIKSIAKSVQIFANVSKGEHASEGDIKTVFGDLSANDILKKIITEGEIQITSEHREKLRAQKRTRLIQLIHANAIEPNLKTPHPVARIDSALDEVKFRVDEYKTAEAQVEDAITALRKVLALRVEVMRMKVFADAAHGAHQLHNSIKDQVNMLKVDWGKDGSVAMHIEFPAGLQEEILNKINRITHGAADVQIEE